MTTSRALAIITIATLPLATLTARGFLASPSPDADPSALPTYDGGSDALEAARKAADEPAAAAADPVGWGRPRKSSPADEPVEYRAAAALAAAGRAAAAKGDVIADVNAAVTEIGGLLAEKTRDEIQSLPGGQTLIESLQGRRAGLQRRSKWLEDRAAIAGRIAALEALLAGAPDGENETKCLADAAEADRQFPAVADDDDATEPPSARTKSEVRALQEIRSRASFRQRQFAAMTDAEPANKLRLLDAFLKDYPSTPDPRDAGLIDEARRALDVARLEVLRAQAEHAETAAGMAKALKKWLAAPPAGPDNRKVEAMEVIKAWLQRNAPEPPAAADLPKLQGLQETIELSGGKRNRVLGWFEQIKDQPDTWRFWWDRGDRADQTVTRGRRDVMVAPRNDPIKIPPVFVKIREDYGKDREKLLKDPLGFAKEFAETSDDFAKRTAEHLLEPVNPNPKSRHELQDAYDKLGEDLAAACKTAAVAAGEFDSAAKENDLRSLLSP